MSREPVAAEIKRSAALRESLALTFDGPGRPSLEDFEREYWPDIAAALSFGWRESQAVDNIHPDTRALLTRPYSERNLPSAVIVFSVSEDRAPQEDRDRAVVTVIEIMFNWKAAAAFVHL